jgi:hypothetical protein
VSAPRKLRTRSPVAVMPLAVSTETCLQLAGIVPRKFREALAAYPDIPRSQFGHTVVVAADAFTELLARLEVGAAARAVENVASVVAGSPPVTGAEPTADAILARIGRRRAS